MKKKLIGSLRNNTVDNQDLLANLMRVRDVFNRLSSEIGNTSNIIDHSTGGSNSVSFYTGSTMLTEETSLFHVQCDFHSNGQRITTIFNATLLYYPQEVLERNKFRVLFNGDESIDFDPNITNAELRSTILLRLKDSLLGPINEDSSMLSLV